MSVDPISSFENATVVFEEFREVVQTVVHRIETSDDRLTIVIRRSFRGSLAGVVLRFRKPFLRHLTDRFGCDDLTVQMSEETEMFEGILIRDPRFKPRLAKLVHLEYEFDPTPLIVKFLDQPIVHRMKLIGIGDGAGDKGPMLVDTRAR